MCLFQVYRHFRPLGASVSQEETRTKGTYDLVDKVFTKPEHSKCTTTWNEGTDADLAERGIVEVNGIPRHVADIRRIPSQPAEVV